MKINTPLLCLALFAMVSFSSCKDEDDAEAPGRVNAATGLRLIHSSFNNSSTPVDLFIDDKKANTNGTIAYQDASTVYPLSSGSHKITAKASDGTVLADTTLSIEDATQYSFFIKDRTWASGSTVASLKTGFVAVPDNHTSPSPGMAKIRFVNTSSAPLNGPTGSLSFSRVLVTGNITTTSMMTQVLGAGNTRMYSDYFILEPGTHTIRLNASTTSILDAVYQYDLIVTLEADKLYTGFGTSTQFTVKTPSKSPLMLIVKANN